MSVRNVTISMLPSDLSDTLKAYIKAALKAGHTFTGVAGETPTKVANNGTVGPVTRELVEFRKSFDTQAKKKELTNAINAAREKAREIAGTPPRKPRRERRVHHSEEATQTTNGLGQFDVVVMQDGDSAIWTNEARDVYAVVTPSNKGIHLTASAKEAARLFAES